jgi:Gpi18-like mannosyltransferase
LYLLTEKSTEKPSKIWRNLVFLLLFFPTSYFLYFFYTESLFLLLSVLTFYFVFSKKYFLASLIVLLAGATRVVGLLLFVPLLVHFLLDREKFSILDFLKVPFYGVISSLGFLSFLVYMHFHTGDFLAPFKMQEIWNRGSAGGLIPFKAVLIYFARLFSGGYWDPGVHLSLFLVFLAFAMGIVLLCNSQVALPKRAAFFAYIVVYLGVITGTASMDSLFRFILVLFPVFLPLAGFMRKSWIVTFIVLFLFVSLRILFLTFFVSKIPGIAV